MLDPAFIIINANKCTNLEETKAAIKMYSGNIDIETITDQNILDTLKWMSEQYLDGSRVYPEIEVKE